MFVNFFLYSIIFNSCFFSLKMKKKRYFFLKFLKIPKIFSCFLLIFQKIQKYVVSLSKIIKFKKLFLFNDMNHSFKELMVNSLVPCNKWIDGETFHVSQCHVISLLLLFMYYINSSLSLVCKVDTSLGLWFRNFVFQILNHYNHDFCETPQSFT